MNKFIVSPNEYAITRFNDVHYPVDARKFKIIQDQLRTGRELPKDTLSTKFIKSFVFFNHIQNKSCLTFKMVHINKNGKIIHIADENGHCYWSYPSSSITRSLSSGYNYHSGNYNSSLQTLYRKAIKTFIFKKHLKKQKCLKLKQYQ